MENRIYGILTIGIVTLIYYTAYKSYRKEDYQLCLLLITIGGLLLRIFTSMDFYLHEWDERYHALVAKNLLDNPFKPMLYTNPLLEYNYRNWTGNHVWVHKQPVPLYSIALSMLVFGKNTIALRIPSILLSTVSILATHHIGKTLVSKQVGILAAFLFSINGLLIESTAGRISTDHIDVFFFSLITIAVCFLLRSVERSSMKSLIIGAIVTGLAILSKWLPALIVVPIWLLFSYQKQGFKNMFMNSCLFTLIVVAVVWPWQLYIIKSFPLEAAWEYEYNRKHIYEVLGPHERPFFYHFHRMRVIFAEIIYLPLLWLIVKAVQELRKRNYVKIIIAIWILIPYVFFSFVMTKMQGYILFTSAAMFIMTSMFFFELKSYELKYRKMKTLILVLLLALPIRYSIERVKPFSIRDRNPEWIAKMQELDSDNGTSDVINNCKYPIETMFHTNLIAYYTTPSVAKLQALKSEGYDIYIDNFEKINSELYNLNFIHYVEITGSENR